MREKVVLAHESFINESAMLKTGEKSEMNLKSEVTC